MPELMRDDSCGKSERVADLMQVIAELNQDGYFASGPCQEPPIGRQRVERTEEAQAVNEVTAEASMGTIRSVLSLPRGT